MRFNNITVRDYGVFSGKHTFDLEPKSGPIVIFGGKNGSGKTTLLEAIRLCLYGPPAIEKKMSREKYESYIRKRMHRGNNGKSRSKSASISLEFEYMGADKQYTYEVTRAWKQKPKGVEEQLIIKRDGGLLAGLEKESWQDFINDIVPPGIASLFFFDGEKIQTLATKGAGEELLGQEIKRLLGIDIVERLQTDLDIYMKKQRKQQAQPEVIERINSLEEGRTRSAASIQNLKQERAQIQSQIDLREGTIQELERGIRVESSGYALQIEQLKEELSQTEIRLEQANKTVQDLASGLMPFTLIPKQLSNLSEQLETEANLRQEQVIAVELFRRLDDAKKEIRERKDLFKSNNLDTSEVDTILHGIEEILDASFAPDEKKANIELVHQLSDNDRVRILGWIDLAKTQLPNEIRTTGEELETLHRKRDELEGKLKKIPEDEVLKPFMEKLNVQHQDLGQLNAQASNIDQQLRVLTNELEDISRDIKKEYETLRVGEALERRLALVDSTQSLLDVFLDRITVEKLTALEAAIASRFNELIRKDKLIERVGIDPVSYELTLYTYQDQILSKEDLSAGEKQMLAIAILWALRQLSGRPFPIVVDTPLARLDSDHRSNLIEQYFPHVSHQVILFSTDTEVDRAYFDALKPNISHAYHLVYDSSSGSTVVDNGYFWKEAQHAA